MFAPMKTAPFFIVNVALTLFNSIPWVSIFMFLQLFGLKLYVIREREVCKRIQKRLYTTSHFTAGHGSGYTLGLWYIGHVDEFQNEAWLVSIQSSYEKLTRETGAVISYETGHTVPDGITVYERLGSFQNVWFKRRQFKSKIEPQEEQSIVLKQLIDAYYTKSNLVAFLHGPPGTGKSMLGIMLASKLNGSYCNTLRPWQPGDSLGCIYSEVEPTSAKPLIIALDEIDTALAAIHSGIPAHKQMPISVQNKTGWNHMLDEIGRGLYPHMILLFTSNLGPVYVNGLDYSYMREGRVDLVIGLNQKIVL